MLHKIVIVSIWDFPSLCSSHNNHMLLYAKYNIYCITITTGANCIGRCLKICALKTLIIQGNSIGDDGISVMMDGLLHNKTLTKLDVFGCELSAKGT